MWVNLFNKDEENVFLIVFQTMAYKYAFIYTWKNKLKFQFCLHSYTNMYFY